jgi:hypothetical protein
MESDKCTITLKPHLSQCLAFCNFKTRFETVYTDEQTSLLLLHPGQASAVYLIT